MDVALVGFPRSRDSVPSAGLYALCSHAVYETLLPAAKVPGTDTRSPAGDDD